jgi:membrane peptidoglycan carboxypeptidase
VDLQSSQPEPRVPRHRRKLRRRRLWTWLIAGCLTPVVIGGTTAVIYVSSVSLPGDPHTPEASTLYYSDAKTILARVGTENHTDVPLSSVPESVRHAVMAAEDRDFYDHPGISVRGVLRAIVSDIRGGKEGASTITQQYVRNAFLTQDVSLDRKTKEMALALKIERKFTKDQILERYLNTIYYGRGAYGIAAAAHAYFGVTPDRLTEAEGAVLAAAIKDPYRYDPANDAAAAQQRWTWIVNAEHQAGWLSAAPAYPKVLASSAAEAGPNGVVVDRVESELADHGISPQMLHTQGLSVVTTLDATAQKAALDQVRSHLSGQPRDLRVALVGIDPRSGAIRAYYGGKQSGYFDDALAIHPAASTFKPIVLGAALERGYSAWSRWDGSSPRTFEGRLGVPLTNHDDLQCPDCSLATAMVESLNTPFYAVTENLGADAVRTLAYNLGIATLYGNKPSLVDTKDDPAPGKTRPDIAIGRYPVSPADLASVYATFAGGGVHHDRYFVQSAASANGKSLWKAVTTRRYALSAAAAATIARVLQPVVRADNADPGRPAAAKTGTQQWGNTHDNQDAWMAGFTPDLASSLWIGKAKPGPIKDKNGKRISGETIPAQLWRDFTRAALSGRTALPFPTTPEMGKRVAFDVKGSVDPGAGVPADPGSIGASAGKPGLDPGEGTADDDIARKKAAEQESVVAPSKSPQGAVPTRPVKTAQQ